MVVDRGEMVPHNDKTGELRLKNLLLADDTQKVARLQSQVPVRAMELTAVLVTDPRSTNALAKIAYDHASSDLMICAACV